MNRVLIAVVLLAAAGYAQTIYQPTDDQMIRLQVKQSESHTKQLQWLTAARALPQWKDLEKAVQDLKDEGEKVKAEQKWDKEKVLFNPDQLTFSEAPKK